MVVTYLTLGLLLQQSPDPLPYRLERDIVTIEGKHYGLMPPEYVTGKGIESVNWIAGNLMSINQRLTVNGKTQRFIKIYDAPKKTLTTLPLPQNDNDFTFQLLEDRSALVQFYADKPEDCSLHLVSIKGSRLLRTGIIYYMATDGRIALGMIRRAQQTDSLRFLLIKNGGCEEFDSGVHGTQPRLWRAKQGIMLGVVPPGAQPTEKGFVLPVSYLFNTQKLAFARFESNLPYGEPMHTAPTAGSVSARVQKVETGNLVVSGDEKSEFPSALIATDTREGQFSFEGNFVSYRFGEHLFVREIRPVSEADMELLREEAERRIVLSRAKQLGTSMMIYIGQNKDVFPGREEKVMELLMPIVKNADMFTGFIYTYEGGSATAIAEPSSTVIGYIQGKYGRAVIYSDSHAKWERRKP